MAKVIVVTLRTPKGTEWKLETSDAKLATVKANAKKMGYQVVKVA